MLICQQRLWNVFEGMHTWVWNMKKTKQNVPLENVF